MINRRHLFRFALLTAAALLTGCSAEILDGHGGQVPICLTASVQQDKGMTRAGTAIQSAQFEQGATFYAYFPNGARIGSAASACHTTFTTTNTSGATDPATQPYFNADASSADVYAYYPQTVTEAANQKFSVSLDQTEPSGYKASDLMYATTTVSVDKSSASSATGLLTFSHKMSKIIVSATAGAGITAIRQVRIVGGNRSITIVNPTTTDESTSPFFGQTPSLSDAITTADNGCVKLYNDATGEATVSCAGLIPPQTIASSTAFLEVVTDVGTATYSLGSAKTFAPGESYTYSISLTLASIGITTAINDWTAAGTTELENGGGATLYSRVLLSAITSESTGYKGYYVGQDGYAYNSIDAATINGTSAVARITYVGSVPGYFDNFLAIALEDAASSNAVWATQMSAANTWASSHSVTVGGTTYNSCSTSAYDQVTADASGTTSKPKSSGAVKGWRVPSVTDWKYIFDGIGGKTVDNSKVTDSIVYGTSTTSGNSDGSHRALLNKWCGQDWNATTKPEAVQLSSYWSSSERAENAGNAWYYAFGDSKFVWLNKTSFSSYVRAVFAY